VIELACGDHGEDKIMKMANEIENGKCLVWTGLSDLLGINNKPSAGITLYYSYVIYYQKFSYFRSKKKKI